MAQKVLILSFVDRELLTFKDVELNRSPWAINRKILPGLNRVKLELRWHC